ncbi:MAG: hypothetical protein KAH96_06850 [Alphaproteobacteria bacterium]|nr:hypothetical protein [Alphaproteobacteria bacterium]
MSGNGWILLIVFLLFRANEFLGMQLLSIHNIFTMNRLMREIRQAIENQSLDRV